MFQEIKTKRNRVSPIGAPMFLVYSVLRLVCAPIPWATRWWDERKAAAERQEDGIIREPERREEERKTLEAEWREQGRYADKKVCM